MKISMIVAAAKNRVIGKENALPWYLPEDLKYFKAKTIGKPVIMGRNTYDAIGKPLPNRVNIVISRNPSLKINGAVVVGTAAAALQQAEAACREMGADEVMVIGGEQIYQLLLNRAEKVYLTEVDIAVEGDAYFPELDPKTWREVSSREPETQGKVACVFKIFERQK